MNEASEFLTREELLEKFPERFISHFLNTSSTQELEGDGWRVVGCVPGADGDFASKILVRGTREKTLEIICPAREDGLCPHTPSKKCMQDSVQIEERE